MDGLWLLLVLGGDEEQLFWSDVMCCRRRGADAASPKAPAFPAPPLPALLQLPDSGCCPEPRAGGCPMVQDKAEALQGGWKHQGAPSFLGAISFTHLPFVMASG